VTTIARDKVMISQCGRFLALVAKLCIIIYAGWLADWLAG